MIYSDAKAGVLPWKQDNRTIAVSTEIKMGRRQNFIGGFSFGFGGAGSPIVLFIKYKGTFLYKQGKISICHGKT